MPYMVKEKLNLLDFVGHQPQVSTILMAGVDKNLASIYRRLMIDSKVRIEWLHGMDGITQYVDFFSPRLLIGEVTTGKQFNQTFGHIRTVRESFPSLPIISISLALEHQELEKLMDLGTVSHINRTLTRPRDVAIIIKNILEI